MHVKDGKLIKVEGDPEGPLNHGYLCPIGAATTQLVYHPDRLKYPQRRIGPRGSGKWERISWDEALDEITREGSQDPRGERTRVDRDGHGHGPPSHPLGLALR